MEEHLYSFAQQCLLRGDSRVLSRRFQGGELLRIRRGVYYPVERWLALQSWERYRVTLAAAAMALRGPTFCYASAAFLWGLPLLNVPNDVHFAVSGRGSVARRSSRLAVHPSSDAAELFALELPGFGERRHLLVGPAELRDGFLLSPVALAAIDAALRVDFTAAVVLLDGARRTIGREKAGPRVADDGLLAAIEALPSAAKRERARELMRFSTSQSESAGESLSRANMHILGFEPPELQHPLVDSGGVYGRGDFFWPGINTVGEFDGRAKYSDRQLTQGRSEGDLRRVEKERDGRIQRGGQRVIHWEWADAINLPRF